MTECIISLTQGKVAIVSPEDFERVNQQSWHWNKSERSPSGYAASRLRGQGRPYPIVLLHRFIMNVPKGIKVDHINGNGLDCRKENLRIATDGQNNCNTVRRSTNKSGFKGVTYVARIKMYRALINESGQKRIHIGYFYNAEIAAHAYDAFARRLHGEFAALNFPRASEQSCNRSLA